jgi:hypothetical protein
MKKANAYRSQWDLSTIPDDLLRTEFGRRIKPPAPRARVDFLMDEADYLRDRDHESQSMTGQLVAEDEDDFEPSLTSAAPHPR